MHAATQHPLIRKAAQTANLAHWSIRRGGARGWVVWRLGPTGWVWNADFARHEDAEDYVVGKMVQHDR